MEHWYIIINKGITTSDVVTLAGMLGMHNLRYTNNYVQIWLTTDSQIGKLCQMLNILEVDFILAKDYNLDEQY